SFPSDFLKETTLDLRLAGVTSLTTISGEFPFAGTALNTFGRIVKTFFSVLNLTSAKALPAYTGLVTTSSHEDVSSLTASAIKPESVLTASIGARSLP